MREAELRQLLEAKAYRQRARGEDPLDVEAELERIRAEEAAAAPPATTRSWSRRSASSSSRATRAASAAGEEPLDVEAEVERQLRDLENLGQ